MTSLRPATLLRRLAARKVGSKRPSVAPVNIVSDGARWALDHLGRSLADSINNEHPGMVATAANVRSLDRTVVHFTSRNLWLGRRGQVRRSNRVVVTFLHGTPDDGPPIANEIASFLAHRGEVAQIVTSCHLIERRLLAWGVAPEHVSVIPLGVDTKVFRPPTAQERRSARLRLDIPDERLVIGSFQKDGVGWEEGMEPKLVKGPDLFVDAVGALGREHPATVLLTGPSRGFVRRGLEQRSIAYRHVRPEEPEALAACYHALDLYLVASRDEGGPLALPEAMACGVPVVATPVGMAPDMIVGGRNGALADSVSAEALAAAAQPVAEDVKLRHRLGAEAVRTAAAYDWRHLAGRYLDEVYRPLIEELRG